MSDKAIEFFTDFAKEVPSADSVYYIHYDYADEETKKLLKEKEELQKQMERIDTRLLNKQLKTELLTRFKENTWYEYSEGDVWHTYFKIEPDDFIRDGSVWLHRAFCSQTLRINTSYTLSSIVMMSADLFKNFENFHEVDEDTIKDILSCVADQTERLL